MAEKEKKEEGKKGEHKGGERKPKKRLRGIMTHIADDGTFVHEHHYEDHRGNRLPPTFGGTSSDAEDLHQHMDDHAIPAAAELGGGQQDEEEPAAQPGQGGTQPDPGDEE